MSGHILCVPLVASVAMTATLAMPLAAEQPAPEFRATQVSEATSQASQSQKPARTVNMVCVDANGKPVPGAEVHVFQVTGEDDGRYVHIGPLKTDEKGITVAPKAVFSNEHGNFDRWFYARVPGRLVGVARSTKWTNRKAINPESRVVLYPSRSVEGQVTVPTGFDPTTVLVEVRNLHVSTGAGFFDYESFPRHDSFRGLDSALPDIFECRPDANGRVRFHDVPARGELTLVATADRLAEAQWRNEKKTFDKPIQLTMDEESLMSGRVLTPERKPAAGVKVTARLAKRGQQQIFFLSSFHAVTDEAGRFAIHGLPEFDVVVSVEDPKKLWTFRPLQKLHVQPHKDPSLTLSMETGVKVSGRVLDPDGKPVHAAGVAAVTDNQGGAGLSDDMTDSDGRFRLRLPAGSACLYFSGLPDGFAYPKPQIIKELDIKSGQADVENLDFRLERQEKQRP